jgi:hypothetical protein
MCHVAVMAALTGLVNSRHVSPLMPLYAVDVGVIAAGVHQWPFAGTAERGMSCRVESVTSCCTAQLGG